MGSNLPAYVLYFLSFLVGSNLTDDGYIQPNLRLTSKQNQLTVLKTINGEADSTPQLSRRMGYTNAMYSVRLVPLIIDLHCSSFVG